MLNTWLLNTALLNAVSAGAAQWPDPDPPGELPEQHYVLEGLVAQPAPGQPMRVAVAQIQGLAAAVAGAHPVCLQPALLPGLQAAPHLSARWQIFSPVRLAGLPAQPQLAPPRVARGTESKALRVLVRLGSPYVPASSVQLQGLQAAPATAQPVVSLQPVLPPLFVRVRQPAPLFLSPSQGCPCHPSS